jgi:hypothetical protein
MYAALATAVISLCFHRQLNISGLGIKYQRCMIFNTKKVFEHLREIRAYGMHGTGPTRWSSWWTPRPTDLQVEHTVTEQLIDNDLVREQIRIAEGHALDLGSHAWQGVRLANVLISKPTEAALPELRQDEEHLHTQHALGCKIRPDHIIISPHG